MKVGHILKRKSDGNYAISADSSVLAAAKKMSEHRIGSLVILDGQVLKSIITERDIMLAVSRVDTDLVSLKVSDIMAEKLVVCDADANLDEAMSLMIKNELGKRIRHLPIMEKDEFLGIISIGDVVEALLTKTEFENKLLKNYIKNWPDESD